MKKFLPIILLAASVGWVVFRNQSNPNRPEPAPETDIVSKTFQTYESLFRQMAADTATKLDSGEIKTEADAWNTISSGKKAAANVAFEDLAKSEGEILKPWTAEKHSKILKGYAKGSAQ